MTERLLRAATLEDVAREASVSLSTASRVLNGSTRRVAAPYRERVEAAAARLGYAANASAQATARGSSSTVALLVADIADPYFGRIAAGVARIADAEGLVVTIAVTHRDAAREAHIVQTLRGHRPRGVILAASRTDAVDDDLRAAIAGLEAAGGRVVMLGAGGDVGSIDVDHRGGAAALGAELAAIGYRSALVLAAAEGVRTSDDRVHGFADGFGAGGGSIVAVRRCGFEQADAHAAMAGLLVDGVPPGTLVFAVSDVMAVGACAAIRDADRSIGSDVAVAGFDDVSLASDVTPRLTTVAVPLERVGELAMQAVVGDPHEQARVSDLRVVLRESTPPR